MTFLVSLWIAAGVLVLVGGIFAVARMIRERRDFSIGERSGPWPPAGAEPLRPFDPAQDRDTLEHALEHERPGRKSSLLLALAVAALLLATPAAASTSSAPSTSPSSSPAPTGRLKCDRPMPRRGFDGKGNRNPNSPAGVRWIGKHCKVTP